MAVKNLAEEAWTSKNLHLAKKHLRMQISLILGRPELFNFRLRDLSAILYYIFARRRPKKSNCTGAESKGSQNQPLTLTIRLTGFHPLPRPKIE